MIHISLHPEELFTVAGFAVTNSIIVSTAILVLFAGVGILLRRRFALVPGMAQNIAESGMEALFDLMDQVLGDRKKSEKYLPLVATIFLFVLLSNWMGLLPGIGSIVFHNGEEVSPLLRSPSTDLNFTLALAIISVLSINLIGIGTIGVAKHAKKFFNFKNPIEFFVGILELISEFVRIISFSFRLFGNIFAGEVLLVVTQFLLPYVLPVPFIMMETFVGLIQAFIFAMLTLVFISVAVEDHGEEHVEANKRLMTNNK